MNTFYNGAELSQCAGTDEQINGVRFLNGRLKPNESHPAYDDFMSLVANLYAHLHLKGNLYNRADRFMAFLNLMLNLYKASIYNDRLIYSRRYKSFSSVHKRYGFHWYTRANFLPLIDSMIAAGLLSGTTGWFDVASEEGVRSNILPTEELRNQLNEINAAVRQSTADCLPTVYPDRQYIIQQELIISQKSSSGIILKDKDKNWINYSANRQTNTLTRRLNAYNELMASTQVIAPAGLAMGNAEQENPEGRLGICERIEDGYIDGTRCIYGTNCHNSLIYKALDCRLYRVFNNGVFTLGGRFYDGEYQSMNSDLRSQILIDGGCVMEADFSALHPRMLYNLEGRSFMGDPYDLLDGNEAIRKAIKLMFNIAVNAKSAKESLQAFTAKFNRLPGNPVKAEKLDLIKEEIRNRGLSNKDLYNLVIKAHPDISKHISSGRGLELQNRDSRIASDVLDHFTRQDIPCLCVHDSFIVKAEYIDELKSVMEETYSRHMGYNCPVNIKQSRS